MITLFIVVGTIFIIAKIIEKYRDNLDNTLQKDEEDKRKQEELKREYDMKRSWSNYIPPVYSSSKQKSSSPFVESIAGSAIGSIIGNVVSEVVKSSFEDSSSGSNDYNSSDSWSSDSSSAGGGSDFSWGDD